MHQTQHCITEASNLIKKAKKGRKTNVHPPTSGRSNIITHRQ